MYKVKNVKTFRGMEGEGYSCSLYRDNKKVAECTDHANGGEIYIRWSDYQVPKVKRSMINTLDELVEISVTPEESLFYNFCEQETWTSFDGKEYKKDPDIKLGEMADEYVNNKRMKRICKGKTLFRPLSQEVDLKNQKSWLTVNAVFSERIKKVLTDKHGECIFLNETIN